MTLELRVTGGARKGARVQFDKTVVTVGRHPLSDLRFDPASDLDVSTKHGELRYVDGVWTLHDLESTNGTFVNGERIASSRAVHEGDVITFGANGPTVQVRTKATGEAPIVPATNVVPNADSPLYSTRSHKSGPQPKMPPLTPSGGGRQDTGVRIAAAVQVHTASMKRWVTAGAAVVVAGAVVAGLLWYRQTSAQEREMQGMLAKNDSASTALMTRIEALAVHDSASARALAEAAAKARQGDGRALPPSASASESVNYSKRLSAQTSQLQSLAQMDLAGVHTKNDAAVAMIASDLDGTFIAGTAFGVTRTGMLVTNRHVVKTESGAPAKRVRVLFANSTDWLPAHVVRMSDSDDLALLQLDTPGANAVVAGVSRSGDLAQVGSAVASIGYPHAVDTPMEGQGMHVRAATTLAPGTVSKRLGDVLQIDSYAAKGSSGSPVFDARGNVVGVVYGGAAESGGRIVYAVPAQRLSAFLAGVADGILR